MSRPPVLQTKRLLLRPFRLKDAPSVRRLAGDRRIAATTLELPHPYEKGMARAWIRTHRDLFDRRRAVNFAITLGDDGDVIGAIALRLEEGHDRAEMGYWIGVPSWNRGFATEAAAAVLEYGFRDLRLNRIHAHCMNRNFASGRVLEKIGMRHEGRLRRHVRKLGVYEDIEVYGILRSEWVEHEGTVAGGAVEGKASGRRHPA